MSDNQVKENDLSKVAGGEGNEEKLPKYEVGFSYDSGLLWSGMPNHHITITVKKHLGTRGNEFYYQLEYFEEAMSCPKIRDTIEKLESYIDARKYDR